MIQTVSLNYVISPLKWLEVCPDCVLNADIIASYDRIAPAHGDKFVADEFLELFEDDINVCFLPNGKLMFYLAYPPEGLETNVMAQNVLKAVRAEFNDEYIDRDIYEEEVLGPAIIVSADEFVMPENLINSDESEKIKLIKKPVDEYTESLREFLDTSDMSYTAEGGEIVGEPTYTLVTSKSEKGFFTEVKVEIYPKEGYFYIDSVPLFVFEKEDLDVVRTIETEWNQAGKITTLHIVELEGKYTGYYTFKLQIDGSLDAVERDVNVWGTFIGEVIDNTWVALDMIGDVLGPPVGELQ